jgi:hypothetical protein
VLTLVEIWARDGDSKGARYYVAMSRYTDARKHTELNKGIQRI